MAFHHLNAVPPVGSLDVQQMMGILLSGKAGASGESSTAVTRWSGRSHIRLSFTHLGDQFPVGFPDGIWNPGAFLFP